MFGYTFFNDSIRKYIILFGTIFNEIYLDRYDADGNVTSTIRVPITYAPRDKAIARVEADPELNRPWSSILPFMSFSLVSMYYDDDRPLKKVNRIRASNPSNKNLAANYFQPVPYNFNFELNVIAKTQVDAVRIIENVIPWFTPDWTTAIKIIDDPETIIDIPLILSPVEMEDRWQGSFEERRSIVYTLSFTMMGWLYGPVRKDKIIKVAKTRVGVEGGDRWDSITTVVPGLTANGEPTSNASLSVPYSQIDWTDDFGYIETREMNVPTDD